MNLESVKTFYELLGHQNQTEIRAIELSKDLKTSKIKGNFFVSSQKEFISKIEELDGKYNLYAGLNERTKNGTEAKDVISVKRIFLDIDCINKPAITEDLQEAERITNEIISKIEEKTELRGTKIYSGNGYQIVYCIPEIEINDLNRVEIESKIKQFNKDLIQKYSNNKIKLDNVGDLPRIIRITGTTNIKGGKTSEFIEVHKDENSKLRDYILSLSSENAQLIIGELETSLKEILNKDARVEKLFQGNIEGFPSRSEAEESLICHLIGLGLDKEQIFKVMASCKIGKWQNANIQYRELTYNKALEVITIKKRDVVLTEKNPFRKLHYSTEHLKYFHEFNSLIGLYGRHYIPIIKARYYQLLGGILQSQIKFGSLETDTRLHIAYPLVTEGGKNELIYGVKNLIEKGILKDDKNYRISEPISYSPESLVGKRVQRIVDNPTGNKPKKITLFVENKGHFDNDFLEFDECTKLITSNSPEDSQAREYISKSENPIGKNRVEKRLVDDLLEETISYIPKNTNSFYFQPFKKIPEEAMLQGFMRRKLIPVGDVSLFLRNADEILFNDKLNELDFSKEQYQDRLIDFLIKIRDFRNKGFFFTDEAREKIVQYAVYINAQGNLFSEKISNYCKLTKFSSLATLVKMSVIISVSYGTNIVNENAVALAYMDLVELMQNTFEFIDRQILGNFDYGTKFQGRNYPENECLKYLFQEGALSLETSIISINFFVAEVIMPIFKIKQTQARNRYMEMKEKGLIDSKQLGQNDSRVWLNFTPNMQKETIEGDKGAKGYNTYNTIFLSKNRVSGGVASLSPLAP